MRKQLASLMLTFIFCVTAVVPSFAANVNVPAADKIKAMEVMLYGAEQEGSLVERMDNIEYDVNGLMTSESILERVDDMYNYLKGKPEEGGASFATRLNMVEWRLNESMSGGPAKARIEAAEKLLKKYLMTQLKEFSLTEDRIDLHILYENVADTEEFKLLAEMAIEGRSHLEMATRRGISVSACKKRVQRAKETLRRKIDA